MEETNIKYSVNLKFTKLEVPEVGLCTKTFPVAGHNEDQQLPKEQQLEPTKPHPQSHQPPKQQVQPGGYHPMADHVEGITKKTGFDPLEIGMRKLKGMVLCDVNPASKESTLSYFQFCQLLIEHYPKHSVCIRHPQHIFPPHTR